MTNNIVLEFDLSDNITVIQRLLKTNYLSKAFTLPRSFLLFRQLIRTWVLLFTEEVSTDKGPVLNSSCSRAASSSGVMWLRGFVISPDRMKCEGNYGDLTPVEKYFAVSDITLQPDYNRSRRIPEVTQLSYYM